MALKLLLAAAALQAAAANPEARMAMEQGVPAWNADSSSWAKLDRPKDDHSMSFVVAVRVDEDRHAALERAFWEVSDPDHANYGKHLSREEVTALLGVPEERAKSIASYFTQQGATEAIVSPNQDMISVTMPVAALEAALDTKVHVFGHDHHKVQIIRASTGYSLPVHVAKDVLVVGELLQFPNLKSKTLQNLVGGAGDWPNDCDAPECKGLVTPAVIAQRYKLPTASAAVNPKNTMAIAEFTGEHYKDSDLQKFSTSCHRDVTVATNIGANSGSGMMKESELDIEYIKAVAPEVPLTVLYQDQFSLLDMAKTLNSMSDPPQVMSVSYGNDEASQSSKEYMSTCNTAFMKAGVRGISILVASGDSGVCGRKGCGLFHFRFKPDFPAGSPYVTSVGGTDFLGTGIGDEMVWTSGGGGFSDTFDIPDYQKDAVAAYKSHPDAKLPPQAYWNNTGRGYPDIAALAGQKTPYCVATSSAWQGVSGTSAACPVAAGVFAKLNGLRLAAGKPALGFLNPFIYKNPSGFQDVAHGINGGSSFKNGFTAVKGWDAATGFGTPDYEALAKLVMTSKSTSEIVV